MSPPAEQAVLQLSTPLEEIAAIGRGRHRFQSGDIPALVNVWILLAVLWVSRTATGHLDLSAALFGVTLFAAITLPGGRPARLSRSALDDAWSITKTVGLTYGLVNALVTITEVGEHATLLAVAIATGPALIAGRSASYQLERRLFATRAPARTLIVGGGQIARRIVQTLATHDEYRLEVVGAVDDDPRFAADELGTRILGGSDRLPELVMTRKIDVVIVAFGAGDQGTIVPLARQAMEAGASVWVVPRMFELGVAGPASDHLWGLPLIRLGHPARSRPAWFVKRVMDVVVAGAGLLALAPLMASIAALIYLDSRGPIFYRQRRVGLDGREFDILKFRSMHTTAETIESTEWDANDERMTRVGRILRNLCLDELPQLVNVLRGEMSLVGPRPERPYFVGLFSDLYPSYDGRHRLPAGITGLAQVHGLRGNTSIEERAVFDNYYVENWSLGGDFKILVKTLGGLLLHR